MYFYTGSDNKSSSLVVNVAAFFVERFPNALGFQAVFSTKEGTTSKQRDIKPENAA